MRARRLLTESVQDFHWPGGRGGRAVDGRGRPRQANALRAVNYARGNNVPKLYTIHTHTHTRARAHAWRGEVYASTTTTVSLSVVSPSYSLCASLNSFQYLSSSSFCFVFLLYSLLFIYCCFFSLFILLYTFYSVSRGLWSLTAHLC